MVTGSGHFRHSVLQYVCVCVCVCVCVYVCVILVTDLSVGGGCSLCVEVVLCSVNVGYRVVCNGSYSGFVRA